MANESALFEDDFLSDFEDDPATPAANDAAPAVAATDLVQKDVRFDEPVFDLPQVEGGDRLIPAISVAVFYERQETEVLMRTVSEDRRMSRANVFAMEGGIPAAIAYLQTNGTPNLLLLESSAPAAQMLEQIDALAAHCDEGVQVMVIGAMNDIYLYRQLVTRGVSEYLVPPVQPVQVIRSIGQLFSDPDAPFIGKSISVIGAKGGVGASTIAHNLAWSIAENAGLNTTLVDLDLSFGTTALDFNHDNAQNVTDALLAPERADDAVIERLLSKATDRLSLFTAPASISQVLEIDNDAYTTVIEGVRRNVPYVVLDLPHVWSQWMVNTLMSSDEVIIVCQPDLASLRNGKNIVDHLKTLRPNDNPPRVVLNMAGVKNRPEIPVKDFAAAIGVEPEIILPFDPKLFGTAANNGQMISETDPDSQSSQAIDHLASALTGRRVEQAKKSLMSKLLGK